MAEIKDLTVLPKGSVTNNHTLLAVDSVANVPYQFTLNGLFPTVSTVGVGGHTLYNSPTLTAQNNIPFKGIKGSNAKLTVTTADSNLLLTLVEAQIDLDNCSNSTALFLKTVNLATNVGETVLGVTNGGTGLSTIAKGGMLYASGANTIAALAAPSDGQLLIGDTGGVPQWATLAAGSNISLTPSAGGLTIASTLATLTANLDAANYNIDLGTGWISGDGTNEGLRVDTSGKVFIGQSAPSATFSETLNIAGNISFPSNVSPMLKPVAATSSSSGGTVNIEGGGSVGGVAGNVALAGGDSSGTGNAGNVMINGGTSSGAGADGNINLSVGSKSGALVVTNTGHTQLGGNLVINDATDGINYPSKVTVIQLTSHATGVTANSTAGTIQLANVSLAAHTAVKFVLTNSTIATTSLVHLSLELNSNTPAANSFLSVASGRPTGGSTNIHLFNPGSGSIASNIWKVHFTIHNV